MSTDFVDPVHLLWHYHKGDSSFFLVKCLNWIVIGLLNELLWNLMLIFMALRG